MDLAIIISIISTAVAVVGGVFGVITYSKNQTLKRQEIILPLMKEFDNNKTLDKARQMLDGHPVVVEGPGQLHREFSTNKLCTYLRDHRVTKVTDPAEKDLRNSFRHFLIFLAN